MHNWFECKARYTKIDDKSGKDKEVTEPYLVDALSFTEAETRLTKELEQMVSGEFVITNINKAKYTDVFFYEAGQFWYKCKVSYVDVDEKSGKEKKVSNMMLVMADTVKEAYERIEESLSEMIIPYDILSIVQSPLVDLFPYFKEEETTEIPANLIPMSEFVEVD